jgi:hypothetical protein
MLHHFQHSLTLIKFSSLHPRCLSSAESITALEGCDDSLDEWMWQHGGSAGQMHNSDIWIGKTQILWVPWEFIMDKDFKGQIPGLETQFTNEPLQPYPSPPQQHYWLPTHSVSNF